MQHTDRLRVVVADDHAIVAESLASLLAEEHQLVAVTNDGDRLIEAVRRLRPAIVVTDIGMPGMSGLDAMKLLKREGHKAKFIFLTMHEDAALAGEALRAGAAGYLLKNSAGEELFTAIREVAAGRTYLTPRIAKEAIAALSASGLSPMERLTSRQRDVLRLVVQGRTMKEAAADLSLSPRTVETHKYEMMHTLGVQTTAELIQYAIRHGVSDGSADTFGSVKR
jgi:DNA-binding NarL/FixJ family response regulator